MKSVKQLFMEYNASASDADMIQWWREFRPAESREMRESNIVKYQYAWQEKDANAEAAIVTQLLD